MPAILAIWNDCAPEALEHYERWYGREHLAERVDIPGFRFGRRFEAVRADRSFFTYYEVDDPSVLASPAYLERQNNPTAWTRRAMESFRGMMRTVCDITYSVGDLRGAFAVTLRLAEGALADHELRAVLERLSADDGVARVETWTASALQTPATREMSIRAEPDVLVPAAIMVECLRAGDADRIAARLTAEVVGRLDDREGASLGVYAFLCSREHARG